MIHTYICGVMAGYVMTFYDGIAAVIVSFMYHLRQPHVRSHPGNRTVRLLTE